MVSGRSADLDRDAGAGDLWTRLGGCLCLVEDRLWRLQKREPLSPSNEFFQLRCLHSAKRLNAGAFVGSN